VLPAGSEETVNEAGGRVLLAGSGTDAALEELAGALVEAAVWEAGPFRPGAWAVALAPELAAEDVVVLPASADGRDLAPRLALVLGRPLHAPVVAVDATGATLVRGGGLALADVHFDQAVVASLQPGCRGTDPREGGPVAARRLELTPPQIPDATITGTMEADAATIDLAEAKHIVAGGAGLGSSSVMALLGRVAGALGCATGATRVVSDAGWVSIDRQIGTTGVVVDPDLYVAVGISGAVQHVSGIGSPTDVVAVNTDASCPMMQLADLAIVTDGPALVAALAARLGLAGVGPEDGPEDGAVADARADGPVEGPVAGPVDGPDDG